MVLLLHGVNTEQEAEKNKYRDRAAERRDAKGEYDARQCQFVQRHALGISLSVVLSNPSIHAVTLCVGRGESRSRIRESWRGAGRPVKVPGRWGLCGVPVRMPDFYDYWQKLLGSFSADTAGDLEHTHLVKGLDFALLNKVRTEIAKKQKADEFQNLSLSSLAVCWSCFV